MTPAARPTPSARSASSAQAPVPTTARIRARSTAPVLALAAWTLFTWGARVRNAAADDGLDGWSRAWSVGVAVAFAVAGAVVGILVLAWVAGRLPSHHPARSAGPGPVPAILRQAARALAVVGSAWWAVRGVQIAVADHSLGFKLVHAVLALVTIVLGVAVIRWSGPGPARGKRGAGPGPTG